MTLPAVDLGIMSEHLSTHEGVINKLKMYYVSVSNPVLKKMLMLHIQTLRNHVTTMLELMNPSSHHVHLKEMANFESHSVLVQLTEVEKDITLEVRATAKLMGSDNFNSALMMKDPKVKNIHLKMSYQDITLQMLYDKLLKDLGGGEYIPKVSDEVQRMTFEKFHHVKNE
ncbi:hypothetical protein [Litchfieldia salsa]|uniref:Uncharacterized protein n=1 Tax=Litchfieldia salsa TaxID=930152 RepID=A0A1H0UQJ7_9BACI|nr:hypothetical protein [Litchfieldia salsa]SDP68434.1 hypothetical protein SAMN05216565_10597 [Litchfieldia salsa]